MNNYQPLKTVFMETRDLDGIDVEETTTVDEQRSNKGKTFAKVAAGIGAGAAAGAGVMAMVDDDVTTPDVVPTELVDASDVADVTAGHIADNNAVEAWSDDKGNEAWPQKHDNEAWPQKHDNEAWPQKHDNEAWPQKHDNEAWPQKHDNEAWPQKHDNEAWPDDRDNEAWPDDRDNEAWPQEQPVDAVHTVHTVKLDMQDGALSPAVPFSGYMADMCTPDGHSLLLDVNGDGVYDIAMSYDDDTYTITDLSLVDDGSTVRLDDEVVVDVLGDESLDDQIDIPDDAVDDLSSDGYLYEM